MQMYELCACSEATVRGELRWGKWDAGKILWKLQPDVSDI
jgi:hypothetical protein